MKLKNAFTYNEFIFAIIAFIVSALVVFLVSNKINRNSEKKIKLSSEVFYSRLSTSYQGFIFSKTKNNDAKNLKNDTKLSDSELLRNHFLKDLKGKEIKCDYFKKENLYCLELPSKIIFGVYFDKNCNLSYQLKGYLEDMEKQSDNMCGYVIYTYKDLKKEESEKYTYMIGLGRYFVK